MCAVTDSPVAQHGFYAEALRAHPRSLFKPRTLGMIFVTLTSSASLRTGVVKTFRCVPRSLDESHLFTRRNRNLDTPRTCSVRRCLRTISSGARRFHQCRPDTAVPIDDSHLCNDCRVAASRLDWLDAHAHRRPHGRRYCFCVHRSWC